MSIQKRYATEAARYYRDYLRKAADESFNDESPILLKKIPMSTRSQVKNKIVLHSNSVRLTKPNFRDGRKQAAPGPDFTVQYPNYLKDVDYRQLLQEMIQSMDQDKSEVE